MIADVVEPERRVWNVGAGVDVRYESLEPQRYRIEFGTLTIDTAGPNQRAYLETAITYHGESAEPMLFDLTIGLASQGTIVADWWFQPCLADQNPELLNPSAKPNQLTGLICIEAPNLAETDQIVIVALTDPPILVPLPS